MTASDKSNRPPGAKLLSVIFISICAATLFFILLEGFLRAFNFSFDTRPRYMEFNFPNPHELHEIFEPDPVTLWRLRPGVSMGEGIEPINGRGFRGPELSENKPEVVIRVITLGDSVTFGAQESYPRLLEKCLGSGYQMINAGVPGYSSLQGLRLFKSRLAALKPDFVIAMFGWNDHWLAHGFTDAEQTLNPPPEKSSGLIGDLRLYQLVHLLILKLSSSAAPNGALKKRVSPLEYKQNLADIVMEAKKSGADVILMTPPSALSLGKVPDFFYYLKFIEGSPGEPVAQGVKRITELHEGYNDVVRNVAAETGAGIVDISREWERRGVSDLFNDPAHDIIHPNAKGYGLIAQILCDKIRLMR